MLIRVSLLLCVFVSSIAAEIFVVLKSSSGLAAYRTDGTLSKSLLSRAGSDVRAAAAGSANSLLVGLSTGLYRVNLIGDSSVNTLTQIATSSTPDDFTLSPDGTLLVVGYYELYNGHASLRLSISPYPSLSWTAGIALVGYGGEMRIDPQNQFILVSDPQKSVIWRLDFGVGTAIWVGTYGVSGNMLSWPPTTAWLGSPMGLDISSQDSEMVWWVDRTHRTVVTYYYTVVLEVVTLPDAPLSLRFTSDMSTALVLCDSHVYAVNVDTYDLTTLASVSGYTSFSMLNIVEQCIAGSTYSATGEAPCAPCTVCGAGYYGNPSCSRTSDTVCVPLDTVCSACAVCGTGTFASSNCSTASNTVCTPCTACSPGYYASSQCTPFRDAVCRVCDVCDVGEYDVSQCTSTMDTQCATCSVCPAGSYVSAACATTHDTVCSVCSTCAAGYYVGTACDATHDTVCVLCPANSWCSGGVKTACPSPSTSSAGSSSYLNCSCPVGTLGSVTSTTATCTQCPIGGFCPRNSCACLPG